MIIRENKKINKILTDKEAKEKKVILGTSDGKSFGTISAGAFSALRGNYLDRYSPVDDSEKKVLNDYKKYAEEQAKVQAEKEKQEYIDNTPALKRYNIDPDNFGYDDLTKWGAEHGQTVAVDGTTMHTYLKPKYEGGFLGIGGKKLSTDQEDADALVLERLAENNTRKKLSNTDLGNVMSGLLGAADSVSFGAIGAAADKVNKFGYDRAGLSQNRYVSSSQAFAKTTASHPVANIAGNIAGSVASLGALGKGVGAATKGIKWISGSPEWVKNAINSGITFAISSGAETTFDGGDLGEVLKNAGINFIGGAVGGALSGKVGAIGEKVLFDKGLQHKIIPEMIRVGTSSAVFAGGKTGATYFLYPEDSRPSAEQMAKDIGVAFAFGAISSAVNTMQTSAQNKKYLDDLYKKMARDYEAMAKASVNSKDDVAGVRKFAKNVIGYSNVMEAYLTGKELNATVDGQTYTFTPNKVRLVGQDKYVQQILSEMQSIKGAANATLNGVNSPTTDIATTGEAMPGANTSPAPDVPTSPTNSTPNSATSPVTGTPQIQSTESVPEPESPSVPGIVPQTTQTQAVAPKVATEPSASGELSDIAKADSVINFAPETASKEVKKLEDFLIARGADDALRKESIDAALEIENAIAGTDKNVWDVFTDANGIAQNATEKIKNKVGETSNFWRLFTANLKALRPGSSAGSAVVITEYAKAYTEALKNNNPEKYNSVFASPDGSDLSVWIPESIIKNSIPTAVKNAGAYKLAASHIKEITDDVISQISDKKAEIYAEKGEQSPSSTDEKKDMSSPKNITLTQVGDFYEAYGDEAVELAKKLALALTNKTVNGERVQMTGFPVSSLNKYKNVLGDDVNVTVRNNVAAPNEKQLNTVSESDIINTTKNNEGARLSDYTGENISENSEPSAFDAGRESSKDDSGHSKVQSSEQAEGGLRRDDTGNIETGGGIRVNRGRYSNIENRPLGRVAETESFETLARTVGNEISVDTRIKLEKKYKNDGRLELYDFSEVVAYDMLTDPENELRSLFEDNIAEYFAGDGKTVPGTDIAGNNVPEHIIRETEHSVVKNKKGQLIPVYHGTDADYEELRPGDIGIHFGSYAQATERAKAKNISKPTIIKAYLNITNPVTVDMDFFGWNASQIAQELAKQGIITTDEGVGFVNADRAAGNTKLRELLIEKGYDGIVYNNQIEASSGKSYIVFNDSQIFRADAKATHEGGKRTNAKTSASPKVKHSVKRAKKADWQAHDVEWYAPGGNTVIAYSTQAASDLIEALATDNPSMTISEIFDSVNYDAEAKKVLQAYIDSGFGDSVASEHFVHNKKALAEAKNETNDIKYEHPYDVEKVSKEYIDSVNPEIENSVINIRNGNINSVPNIINVTELNKETIRAISKLVGFDISGYACKIERDRLVHIDNRHGINGEHDQSLSDPKDTARMGYAINHGDSVNLLTDKNGNRIYDAKYNDKNNNSAPIVVINSKIDGTYCISQAVPDSKKKTVWITSARIEKAAVGSQVPNDSDAIPQPTSETPLVSSSASDNIVSQDNDVVKNSVRSDVEKDTLNLTDKCEINKTKHTKTGKDIWVVTLKDRISRDEFKELNAKVKKAGGYYSNFTKAPNGKAMPGFVFAKEPGENAVNAFNSFFGEPEESVKNNIKESAKNDTSESSILARESKSDGGGLRSGASGADEGRRTEGVDRPDRQGSGEVLQGSALRETGGHDDGNAGTGIHRTNDGRKALQESGSIGTGNGERGRGELLGGGDGTLSGVGGQSEERGQLTETTENAPELIETGEKSIAKKRPSNKDNFVITDNVAKEADSTLPNAEDNIEAMELLLKLENEGRAATPGEKAILAKYKGWGGIDTRYMSYKLTSRFNNLFDYEQRKAMQSSQNNAFFTPTKVIDSIYNGLKRMGFKGGNVLEPSMGTGNFFGRMPNVLSAKSALTGVELESYTARIAQYLYPGATIINKPFQDVAFKNGTFDLVVGNVPFGTNKISYNKKKYSLHNYFIISSLDKVRDGGIVAVITSSGTLDSYGIDARAAIMDKADVIACYKLPEKVFSRNANTDVQSDLLILRRRPNGEKPKGDSILNVKETDDGLRLNEYFIKHPENVLGTLAKGSNAWGEATTVLNTGDFYERLDTAMKKLPKDIVSGKTDLKPVETIASLSEKPRFFEKNGAVYADDGAGIDAATAMAITSGNPLVREKIDIDKEVARLKTLKQNYMGEVYRYQDAIAKNPALISQLSTRAENIRNDIALRNKDGEKPVTVIKGKAFEKQSDANKALTAAVSGAPKNGKFSKLGTYGSFDIMFKGDTGGMNYSLVLKGGNEYQVEYAGSGNNIARMAGVLKRLDADLDKLVDRVETLKTDLEFAKNEIEKPFEKEAELEKALEKQKDVTYRYEHYNEKTTPDTNGNSGNDGKPDAYSSRDTAGTDTDERWKTERVNEGKDNNITLAQIVEEIRKRFEIPISTGKVTDRSASGIYKEKAEAIRTRIANNLPTISHELGHHLEKMYFFSKLESAKLLRGAVSNDFLKQYPPEKRTAEAIAEFVRTYLKNTEEAKKLCPEFYDDFTSKLLPGDLDAVNGIASMVNEYLSYGASKRFSAAITSSAKKEKMPFRDKWSQFYTDWVDQFHPMKEVMDYVEDVTEETASGKRNAYKLATNSLNAHSIANFLVSEGFRDLDGKLLDKRSLIDSISMVDSKDLNILDEYLVLRHSLEWIAPQNKDVRVKRVFGDDTLEDVGEIKSEIGRIESEHPEIKEAAENLYEYQRNILEHFAVQSGLMTSEMFDKLWNMYPAYVPFYRAVGKRSGYVKGTFANQKSPIMRAKGSGEQIISPVESIIRNTEKIVKASLRNQVATVWANIADKVEGFGQFIEKVPPDMIPSSVNIKNLKERFNDLLQNEVKDRDDYFTASELLDEIFGDSVTSFTPAVNADKRIIAVMKDGRPSYYQVHDEALYKSIAEMSPKQTSGLLAISQKIMQPMKLLITQNNPIFAVTNALRDIGTAYKLSPVNNPVTFGKLYVDALSKIITSDEMYKQYKAMGGGHSSELSANIDNISKTLRRVAEKDSGMAKRLGYAIFLHPVDTVAAINDAVESVPRLMEFIRTLEAGGDLQDAIYNADDITSNFKRSGSGATAKAVNKLVMFNNAAIQGIDKLARTLGDKDPEKRRKLLLKWALHALLVGVIGYIYNKTVDEEGYENLSSYKKNNFYNFAIGDGKFISIPKPRENALLDSLTERTMEYFVGENKEAFYNFGEYMASQLLPPMLPDTLNPINALHSVGGSTVLGGLIDIGFNRDFKGSPIESEYDKYLPSNERYSDTTSKLAYGLGQTKLARAWDLSPKKIDHLLSQYTGILQTVNKALFPLNDERRDMTVGLRNKFISDSNYSTDVLNKMYENKEKAKKAFDYSSSIDDAVRYEQNAIITSYISGMNKAVKALPDDQQRGGRAYLLSTLNAWDYNETSSQKTMKSRLKGMDISDKYIVDSIPGSVLEWSEDKVKYCYQMTPREYAAYTKDYLTLIEKYRKYQSNKASSDEDYVSALKSTGTEVTRVLNKKYKNKFRSVATKTKK